MGGDNLLKKAEDEVKKVGSKAEDATRSAGSKVEDTSKTAAKDVGDAYAKPIEKPVGEYVKPLEQAGEVIESLSNTAAPDPTLPEVEKQDEQERKIRQYFTGGGSAGQRAAGVSGRQRLFGN